MISNNSFWALDIDFFDFDQHIYSPDIQTVQDRTLEGGLGKR